MHGFRVHLGVCYQYWGREEGIVGLGCVYFQKMLGSRSCHLMMTSWAIQRRGPEQAQHQLCIARLHTWDCLMLPWMLLEPCRLCL